MGFTATETKALKRINGYADKLDISCKNGEVEDELVDKAQDELNRTFNFLGVKANNQEAFVIYEVQSIIHWIKSEQDNAFDLIKSAKDIKGDSDLRTATGRDILALASPEDEMSISKTLSPGILFLLSLILLYLGGISGGVIGAGLSGGGLVCLVVSIIGFIRKAAKSKN